MTFNSVDMINRIKFLRRLCCWLLILVDTNTKFSKGENPKQHWRALGISWIFLAVVYVAFIPAQQLLFPLYDWAHQQTDQFIQFNAGTDSKIAIERGLPPMELYEIDDEAYRKWHSPSVVPRDKLANLINRARLGGAAVIVVDIDLTYPAWVSENDQLSKADLELGSLLQSLNESAAPSPIIILSRSLERPLNKSGRINNLGVYALPKSFLDKYIPNENRVHWASTLFSVDGDFIVRRWRTAEIYCAEDGYLKLLPAVQLLATVAYNATTSDSDPVLALKNFKGKLEAVSNNKLCNKADEISSLQWLIENNKINAPVISLSQKEDGRQVDLAKFGETEQINYRLTPPTDAFEKEQMLSTKVLDLETKPARLDVDGRLVIIGATYQESKDFHPTPITSLPIPGVYILANAIDSLQNLHDGQSSTIFFALTLIAMLLVAGVFFAEQLDERKNTDKGINDRPEAVPDKSTWWKKIGIKRIWWAFNLLVFIAVGAFGYSPGSVEAALPIAVILVTLWYSFLGKLAGWAYCKNPDCEYCDWKR